MSAVKRNGGTKSRWNTFHDEKLIHKLKTV